MGADPVVWGSDLVVPKDPGNVLVGSVRFDTLGPKNGTGDGTVSCFLDPSCFEKWTTKNGTQYRPLSHS